MDAAKAGLHVNEGKTNSMKINRREELEDYLAILNYKFKNKVQ